MKYQWNNFMVGITTTWRTVLKGLNIRKAQNHRYSWNMVSHSDSGKLEHGAVFLILEMITQPSSPFIFLLTKDSDKLFDFGQIKQAKIELEVG